MFGEREIVSAPRLFMELRVVIMIITISNRDRLSNCKTDESGLNKAGCTPRSAQSRFRTVGAGIPR